MNSANHAFVTGRRIVPKKAVTGRHVEAACYRGVLPDECSIEVEVHSPVTVPDIGDVGCLGRRKNKWAEGIISYSSLREAELPGVAPLFIAQAT